MLFQWNAAAHVRYQDSEQQRPASAATPWNWFYINAIHLDTDGNLLISARYAWTVYKVNLHTGNIIWVLGGKHSTFRIKAAPGQVLDREDEIFAYQHDPEAIGNDEYTVFDDESGGGSGLLPYSRVVTVRLDLATKVATLVKSTRQPRACWPQKRGTRRPPVTVTCSSAGAPYPTSPSSARPGTCCSTPSCQALTSPTAPTACPGIRLLKQPPEPS